MRKLALALLLLSVLSSCRVLRPSLMLKTPKNYTYDKISDTMSVEEYRISRNDIVLMKLLSNEGFKLVDISTVNNVAQVSSIETTVEQDGTVKMPLLGRVTLEGMTIREAEQFLETRFSEFYISPFVVLKVLNKRITVFNGSAGGARVVNITNTNTTVFETLALSGGITEDGKAYRIKLIRRAKAKPLVYLIDLSTINGLKDGNTVVQANDIIYVESRDRVARRLTTEIFPYLSILSSILLVVSILKR